MVSASEGQARHLCSPTNNDSCEILPDLGKVKRGDQLSWLDSMSTDGVSVVFHVRYQLPTDRIDVKQLFGMSAILNQSRVELVIHLEMWDETKEYDRIGLEDHLVEILGMSVPRIVMPVRPGRNIAILIEVSALHQRLKARGINTALEMQKNLLATLTKDQPAEPGSKSHAPTIPRHRRTPYRRR